jgi:peptidoglycan/xylan/chitin deacetylase (PgdA/CDA1 family)
MLALGASLVLAGCGRGIRALGTRDSTIAGDPLQRLSNTGIAPSASITADPQGGPPITLGQIPAPRPGAPVLVSSGPSGTSQIALTIDDGYCGDCIAKYVGFAQSSGVHITFNPNGTFGSLWTPAIVETLQPLIANGQVQIGNHTWDHANLLTLSASAIRDELTRNDAWVQKTFGITSRPWFRPPYGYYDQRVEDTVAAIGYTKIMMWNGSFGDSNAISAQELLGLADRYLKPGTIMLGHLNHPTILTLFDQIQSMIATRGLDPVTLDEMFGTSRMVG